MNDPIRFDDIQIEPINNPIDFGDGYIRFDLSPKYKGIIDSFVQQIPSVYSISSVKNLYCLRFPSGVEGSLMTLRKGELAGLLATPIRGEKGRFVGSAGFQKLDPPFSVAALGAFSAMSIVTGQYFMTQINKDLKMMKMSLDKVLEFLYGDKKAELLASMNFVKYAYQNYNSIMERSEQRTATIASLQDAKMVAMKDIEFYLGDLTSAINTKGENDILAVADKALQIKDSLEYSIQLYCASSLAEVYYAQNTDTGYLQYVNDDLMVYLDKCEKRILSSFSALDSRMKNFKGAALLVNKNKFQQDKQQYEENIDQVVRVLNSSEESAIRSSVRNAMSFLNKNFEYYVSGGGNLYIKNA